MPETSKRKNTARLHNLYLGVDGGGTKTHIAIVDNDAELVCEGFAGASNPLRVGVETAVSNIIAAINSACDSVNKNRGDIVSATLGLAGVRRENNRPPRRSSWSARRARPRLWRFCEAH